MTRRPLRTYATLRGLLHCALAGVLGIIALHVPTGHASPSRLLASADTSEQRSASASSDSPSGPQVGVFVQTVLHTARGATSTPEGFHVPRARLSAEGRFDSMLSYEVEADFADDVLLKDARAAYRPTPHLTLGTGQFKVPFSYGELVSSAETDFVQRPRAARQLSVGRRTGVDVIYQAWNERLRVHSGIFSGSGQATSSDASEDWLSAARVVWTATTRGVRTEWAVNAAYVQHPDGGRTRYGADVRMTRGPAFLTAEMLAAPEASAGPEMGAYVTAGYALSATHLIRAQWDYLSPGAPATSSAFSQPHSLIGMGYTLRLAAPLRVEVDYLAPLAADAFDRSAVFVNLQIDL